MQIKKKRRSPGIEPSIESMVLGTIIDYQVYITLRPPPPLAPLRVLCRLFIIAVYLLLPGVRTSIYKAEGYSSKIIICTEW